MEYRRYELRLHDLEVKEDPFHYKVESSRDVYNFCKNIINLHLMAEENMYAIFISCKGDIIGYQEVSKGLLTSAPAHPREVFKGAIISNAASILLAHNHPSSGDPTPSMDDIEVTSQLCKAGDILGITLLDHVIIGDHRFVSMKSEGYI